MTPTKGVINIIDRNINTFDELDDSSIMNELVKFNYIPLFLQGNELAHCSMGLTKLNLN